MGILKSKLDKLKDKIDNLDNNDIENNFTENETEKEGSFREKYKSISLLSKTKQLLKDYDVFEDDYLSPGDLNELQSDLAQISSEIKEDAKQEAQWESIKTGITIESDPERFEKLLNLQDYWRSALHILFNAYVEKFSLNTVGNPSNFHLKLRFPLLARLINKIKAFNEDENILLLL